MGPREEGLPGVRVSNGESVVLTDAEGRWSLPYDDDTVFFVIKPRDWAYSVYENALPRFYYIHRPAGSPELKYGGIAPTGPLPASIDFGLRRSPESDRFEALFFGDTQSRNVREVEYLRRDILLDLIGGDYAFGVTLGDVAFDDLSVFEPQNKVIGKLGIPWHNVLGNHDENYDAPSDEDSDDAFQRVFGPATYSFDYGPVHFVILDDVIWHPKEGDKSARYTGGLTDSILRFVEEDLRFVPRDQLVVYMMHIPIVEDPEKARFFALLEGRPHTLSFSAHTHTMQQHFLGADSGWPGPQPHHHITAVTACGSWWGGPPDAEGVPVATMSDGAPNGYLVMTFDGASYSARFVGAREGDRQMHLWAPPRIRAARLADASAYANVWGGNERSTVEMRVCELPWVAMERVRETDPVYLRLVAASADLEEPYSKLWDNGPGAHLWRAPLPSDLAVGKHLIQVRTTDMYGNTFTETRVLRVTE